MPPKRWLDRIESQPETVGELLTRLRDAQPGLLQKTVCAETGVPQNILSQYELGRRLPTRTHARKLNEYYALPRDQILDMMEDERRRERTRLQLPGPSVAIPAEPELIEAVRALFLLETHELPAMSELIRLKATEPEKREDEAVG